MFNKKYLKPTYDAGIQKQPVRLLPSLFNPIYIDATRMIEIR